MSPDDAEVAARSFPRRWRALFASVEGDDDANEVLRRHGGSSPSALALAQRAREVLGATAERLARVLREDSPPLSGDPPPATPGDPEDVLDGLALAADDLARAIGGVGSESWGRPASLSGKATDAIGVVQAGIDEAAALLRQAEQVLEEVRR